MTPGWKSIISIKLREFILQDLQGKTHPMILKTVFGLRWKAVYQYVFALSHGAGVFYYGDWIDREGVAICSCNDGLRPVIMKIERTDEESHIDYEPVER